MDQMTRIRRGGGFTIKALPAASRQVGATLFYTREGQFFARAKDGAFHLMDLWQAFDSWRPFFWNGAYYQDAIKAIAYVWDIEEGPNYRVLPNNGEPADTSLNNLRRIYVHSPYYQRVAASLESQISASRDSIYKREDPGGQAVSSSLGKSVYPRSDLRRHLHSRG